MKVIHYGSESYDDSMFYEISNRHFVKPKGGLWTSPVKSNHSWKRWCIENDFHTRSLDKFFIIDITGANILTIEGPDQLYDLPSIELSYGMQIRVLDFEKLMKKYDAIHLTEDGEISTRFTEFNLYGWDCESVLVMNRDLCLSKKITHPYQTG